MTTTSLPIAAAPISDHSAQHESLAGSLKYESAAIFRASAMVG